jgi:hypothetical protein
LREKQELHFSSREEGICKSRTKIRLIGEDPLNFVISRKLGDREISQFPPDSYVLIEYPDTGLGKKPPNKLMTALKGPYRVVENIGAEYRLLNLVNNKIEEAHVKRLRPFDFDPTHTDPRDVANADVGFENVERVLTHKGKLTRKNTLEFKVHWEGCPDSEDSWLPWKELRSNEALHQYLIRLGRPNMVPREFR